MNRQEALALYKEETSRHRPSNPLVYAAKHVGYWMSIISKDPRMILLKVYLESLPDPKKEINYEDFRRFLSSNYPGAMEKYFIDLRDYSTLPCPEIFKVLWETAPILSETKAKPIELTASSSTASTVAADLSKFPAAAMDARPATTIRAELSLGDLHANAMKLIYILIREKVLTGISEEDYLRLNEIYKKSVADLTEAELTEFETLLAKAKAHVDRPSLARLIGDVLCDRGSNDFFILLILERLSKLEIPLKVEASNHDVEFMRAYQLREDGVIEFAATHLSRASEQQSLSNLQQLLQRFPKLNEKVAKILEEHYFPKVELLSYVLGPDGKTISIFTHAPVGLETIEALAEHFALKYKDASIDELRTTIDGINEAVKARGGIAAAYSFLKDTKDSEALCAHPLYRIIWNLSPLGLKRPYGHGRESAPYYIHWVHGHSRKLISAQAHIANLDDELGKGAGRDVGEYTVCYSPTAVGTYSPALAPATPPKSASGLSPRGSHSRVAAVLSHVVGAMSESTSFDEEPESVSASPLHSPASAGSGSPASPESRAGSRRKSHFRDLGVPAVSSASSPPLLKL